MGDIGGPVAPHARAYCAPRQQGLQQSLWGQVSSKPGHGRLACHSSVAVGAGLIARTGLRLIMIGTIGSRPAEATWSDRRKPPPQRPKSAAH